MPFIEQLGMQAATEASSGILGMALGAYNDHRQLKQQGRLQEQQIRGQKEMADYQMMKQLQMWKDTGYKAQMEQIKEAGLNPALLYGMGSGGGQSMGNPGDAHVTGGVAPQGGREVQDMIGMGIQFQLLKAQKENIEAQTEKTKGEAANLPATGENIKASTASLTQGVENMKAVKILTEVQTDIANLDKELKGKTLEDQINIVAWEEQIQLRKMAIMEREDWISKATYEDKIKQVRADLFGTWLRNALTGEMTETERSKQSLMSAEETKMIRDYVQRWDEIEIMRMNGNTNRAAQMQTEWEHDLSDSSKLPLDLIEKAVQAILLKNILQPGRNPIQGFKPQNK